MQKACPTMAVMTVWLICACDLPAVTGQALPARPLPGQTAVATPAVAEVTDAKAVGQMLYVPVYSHIYYGGKAYGGRRRFELAVTLSIRNTDLHQAIMVLAARYYDSAGKLLQDFLEQPLRLGPLASTEVFVEESDVRGGVGANFLVEWRAEAPVNAPVVEAVMIGTAGTQGLSFVSPGRVISQHRSP